MDIILNLLLSYGYVGMLVASFIAGSFFPFSSEAIMVGLQAAGLDPVMLIIYGTIGNVLGSMFNYTIGPVSYTHLRAQETPEHIVCRLLV